jgi:hypothetical protein
VLAGLGTDDLRGAKAAAQALLAFIAALGFDPKPLGDPNYT